MPLAPEHGVHVHEQILIYAVQACALPNPQRDELVQAAVRDNLDRLSDNAKVLLIQRTRQYDAAGWPAITADIEASRSARHGTNDEGGQ